MKVVEDVVIPRLQLLRNAVAYDQQDELIGVRNASTHISVQSTGLRGLVAEGACTS